MTLYKDFYINDFLKKSIIKIHIVISRANTKKKTQTTIVREGGNLNGITNFLFNTKKDSKGEIEE